jgi:hypothetical protein
MGEVRERNPRRHRVIQARHEAASFDGRLAFAEKDQNAIELSLTFHVPSSFTACSMPSTL